MVLSTDSGTTPHVEKVLNRKYKVSLVPGPGKDRFTIPAIKDAGYKHDDLKKVDFYKDFAYLFLFDRQKEEILLFLLRIFNSDK